MVEANLSLVRAEFNPQAKIVFDRFHVQRLASKSFVAGGFEVRRRSPFGLALRGIAFGMSSQLWAGLRRSTLDLPEGRRMKPITRLHRTAGATLMEYVLVLIVVGLTILFVARHLGASLRARYGAAKATTDMTKIVPGTHVEVDDQGLTGTAKNVPD